MKNNKRVLYISYDGMTDPLGQSQVIPYLQGLSKLGYQFTLLSFEKKDKFIKRQKLIKEILDAAGIDWQPQTFTSRPPLLSKIYDVWKMKRSATRLHRLNNFNLIHCRSYVSIEAGLYLKRKFDTPVVFDMRGFWVDEKKEAGGMIWKILYKFYKNKEKKFLNKSDSIVTLTTAARNEIMRWNLKGLVVDKISVIPCCADLDLFSPVKLNEDVKTTICNELNITGRSPVITYLGSLGPQYGINEMLFFFQCVKKKYPVAKLLFFTKDDKSLVLDLLNDYSGISESDLHFLFVERDKVPSYLSISDFSIFFYYPSYSRLACSPTKFAELLGMNIPVICNHVGDISSSTISSPPHIILDNLSEGNLEKAANQLDRQGEKYETEMRKFALKNFSLQKGIESYHEIYNTLII